MASYCIGLSLLSGNRSGTAASSVRNIERNLLHAEARRILSLLAGHPIEENDIAKEENGRPFFPGYRLDFNISHSGNMAAVSLVKGKNLRTGCDIQLMRTHANIRKIAEQFFHAAERDYIFLSDEPRNDPKDHPLINQKRFFQIWTMKECFLKLRGFSIFDIKHSPSFICSAAAGCADTACTLNFVFNEDSSSPLSFSLYELEDSGESYMLAVAIEGTGDLKPDIQWFSQSVLTYKSCQDRKITLP